MVLYLVSSVFHLQVVNSTIKAHLLAYNLTLLFYLNHFITGTDYLVNLTHPLSRVFTVSFLPLQANSTENVIQLSDDSIFEGTESFGLRIVEARFTGQAAEFFRADDTLNNAFATVHIADDDCE